MTTGKAGEVGEFFAGQTENDQYRALKEQTAQLDAEAGVRLNGLVSGDVLSIGGVWDFFECSDAINSLTVLDVAIEMLDVYAPEGSVRVVGDLYRHDFGPERFDTIVFSLMLHHTAAGDWRNCRQRVVDAVGRAARWLRPGGRVIVLEYCPQLPWQLAQRAVFPVTRRLLGHVGQPLVVMYRRRFYERVLSRAVGATTATRISPKGSTFWHWYPVFMSIPWLRIPLGLYPRLHIITATLTAPLSPGR